MEAAVADRRMTAEERRAQKRRWRAFTREFYRQNVGILSLEGLTRVVVTHRLEAPLLEKYDTIYVLRGGVGCEAGSFRELMAGDTYFRSLYNVSQEA